MQETTLVPAKTVRDDARVSSADAPFAAPDARGENDLVSTRLISREFVLDGVKFQWWAVGEGPALVTVKSSIFGSRAEFAQGDSEAFAMHLAESVLSAHYDRSRAVPVGRPIRQSSTRNPGDSPLTKAGWFDRV